MVTKLKGKKKDYLTKDGSRQEIQGIKRPVKLCPITASQLGKCVRKGYLIYVVQVGYYNTKEKTATLEAHQ